ncbi:DNA-binding transcriptional regulator, MerR family [Acetitomaculum ruminis DSM 5522]|uniref:DNA-binding transcriptional regulator, MerR family n=1 Tax=Acetitomaculum ruminis DSM 5522 TaxID=1120918 RepID=A0A1I0ZNL9_9FIRM|nr:MerR family transcriptional regulator [Acetitomaculum ruminis]SFB26706.1 DNA-binding transcriptional regulator, MerR family [Acetitomaculum ruminis DSM 5522]
MSDNYSNEKSEYSLLVSDFAKLCNTTRDTLRYYYNQGLLLPWKNPKNGYHYYSASQISSFFFINTMRQSGCSIAEIKSLIYGLPRKEIEVLAEEKIANMEKEALLMRKKIASMRLGMWILKRYNTHKPNVAFLGEIPQMAYSITPVSNPRYAYHAADIANDISTHLSKAHNDIDLPLFPAGVSISYEDLINKNYVYSNVVSLSLLEAKEEKTFPVPSTKAVLSYTYQNTDNIEKTYKKMLSYIKKNRLKPVSDLFSISLINLYDERENHTYFKYLFICVE